MMLKEPFQFDLETYGAKPDSPEELGRAEPYFIWHEYISGCRDDNFLFAQKILSSGVLEKLGGNIPLNEEDCADMREYYERYGYGLYSSFRVFVEDFISWYCGVTTESFIPRTWEEQKEIGFKGYWPWPSAEVAKQAEQILILDSILDMRKESDSTEEAH